MKTLIRSLIILSFTITALSGCVSRIIKEPAKWEDANTLTVRAVGTVSADTKRSKLMSLKAAEMNAKAKIIEALYNTAVEQTTYTNEEGELKKVFIEKTSGSLIGVERLDYKYRDGGNTCIIKMRLQHKGLKAKTEKIMKAAASELKDE